MTRRLARRPRAACPLAPTGVACLSFGAEASCVLCTMIDLDAPVSAVTLGRSTASDQLGDAEAQFWAHLAKRFDGGPTTRAELVASWDPATPQGRDRPWRAEHQFWAPAAAPQLPPPF